MEHSNDGRQMRLEAESDEDLAKRLQMQEDIAANDFSLARAYQV